MGRLRLSTIDSCSTAEPGFGSGRRMPMRPRHGSPTSTRLSSTQRSRRARVRLRVVRVERVVRARREVRADAPHRRRVVLAHEAVGLDRRERAVRRAVPQPPLVDAPRSERGLERELARLEEREGASVLAPARRVPPHAHARDLDGGCESGRAQRVARDHARRVRLRRRRAREVRQRVARERAPQLLDRKAVNAAARSGGGASGARTVDAPPGAPSLSSSQ